VNETTNTTKNKERGTQQTATVLIDALFILDTTNNKQNGRRIEKSFLERRNERNHFLFVLLFAGVPPLDQLPVNSNNDRAD
jgi:hypothetical protein